MAMTKLVTAADLWEMGEDARFELRRGVLHEMAAAGLRYGKVGGRFATHLGIYGLTTGAGEVITSEAGFQLERDPDTILVPDVSFIRAERMPPEEHQITYGQVIPDLVVEVKSPSESGRDVRDKVEAYLRAGVPLVWYADPDKKTITASSGDGRERVYRIGEDLDGGSVLPGFRVPVAAFF